MTHTRALLVAVAALHVLSPNEPAKAEEVVRTFTIREPFGLPWGPDRVNYRVDFPEGQVMPAGFSLKDGSGRPVAGQLSEVVLWPDQKTVKTAILSFMVTLKPDEVGRWTLTAGIEPALQPPTDLKAELHGDRIELCNAKTGIRLPGGLKTFSPPLSNAAQIPAPIQAIRVSGGRWIGRGVWRTDRPCLAYSATLMERGPVFARAALKYDFAGDTRYTATVELSSGQDLAVIDEEFDLSRGKRLEMPELPGTKPGETFEYVLPRFDPPQRGMLWDWWGGTHGRVPSPDCYQFSFYDGLEPGRCQWHGRMYHLEPKTPQGTNDTALHYDADGRVISINAFLNWGDDESLYFGAYHPDRPDVLAVVGMRPSRWVHPDLEPHPIKTIHQMTQTNNLWIERRKDRDLLLRAPVGMGRRVYGIGVVQNREAIAKTGKRTVTADLLLRHVRYGRQRLDEIKDWVLDYVEPGKYPRLLVPPGDMARMQARARAHLKEDGQAYVRYLLRGDAESAKQLVEDTIQRLQAVCQEMATTSRDHNSYAMGMPRLAHAADVAMGVPECTREQAALIRRYVAACAYNCLSPDYVPPREAGYGWGSANMMEALRSRGASLTVALLPEHPQGDAWRKFLVRFLTLNAQAKINPAGCTLEIGAYGAMGIEFATVPLIALSGADPSLDLSPILPRLAAAARARLSYLLPHDVRGGFRAPAPIGDSPYEPEGTFPYLAAVFQQRDPHLARQILWGIRESGGQMGGFCTLPGLLFDPGAEPLVPDLGSEHFQGSGMIMRSGFPRQDETYVNINAGAFAIGHGHADRGCFLLYAKGAPLVIDHASQYVPSIGQTWLHGGGLTFDHDERVRPCPGKDRPDCFFTGKVWMDHKVEPFTCLEPDWDPAARNLDEAMGKVTAFATLPAADYGAMTRRISFLRRVPYMLPEIHEQFLGRGPGDDIWIKEPFDWTRRFVFVKSPDPLGPNYLVFRDDLAGNKELRPALNLWCLADKVEGQGPRATYTGQHGVDLDVFVAEPSSFAPRTHRAGHTNGRAFAAHYRKTFGKPFEEYQLLYQVPQQPGQGGFFVALVPRQHDQAGAKSETFAGGKAMRLAFPQRTDTAVVMNQPDEITLDGLTLRGTAFVLTTVPGKTTVTMLAPGAVKRGGQVLVEGQTPKTIELRP